MRKTLLGMAGVAALALGANARAADERGTTGAGELRDEGRQAVTVVHRDRANQRAAYGAEETKPCDASAMAGSASGEPSRKDAEREASRAEFLRNVWTTP